MYKQRKGMTFQNAIYGNYAYVTREITGNQKPREFTTITCTSFRKVLSTTIDHIYSEGIISFFNCLFCRLAFNFNRPFKRLIIRPTCYFQNLMQLCIFENPSEKKQQSYLKTERKHFYLFIFIYLFGTFTINDRTQLYKQVR